MTVDLKPWSEVQKVLPPLSTEERAQLRRGVSNGAVKIPILHLPDGRIIDGHHRWELSNHTYPFLEEIDLPEEKAFALALTLNIARRHLSLEQINAIRENVKQDKEIQKELAHQLRQRGMTQADAAAVVGVARKTIDVWEEENITNGKNTNSYIPPDYRVTIPKDHKEVIYDRCQAGQTQAEVAADYKVSQPTISKIVKDVKKRKRAEVERQSLQERGKELAGKELDSIIRLGDFRETAKEIQDDSVDLIFTDPPYDEKSIPLYGSLAEVGARVLKPGGSLICYVGHYALPEILPLMTPHLRFWWTLACDHSGAAARLPGKWVFVHWKPMFWFVKDRRRDDEYIADMVKSKPVDKIAQDWEQSLVEADYYISRLTRSGEFVLDPMCGSGTTCLAALKLDRRTLGIEKEKKRAYVARTRIAEYLAGRTAL